MKGILLENKSYWIKYEALSVSGPPNAGPPRPGYDVPSVPPLRGPVQEVILFKQNRLFNFNEITFWRSH